MKHLQVVLPVALTLQLFFLACLARQLPSSKQYNPADNGHLRGGKPLRGPSSESGPDTGGDIVTEDHSSGQTPTTTSTDTAVLNRTASPARERAARCGACEMRDHQKALRIESIKEQILRKLNLKSVPNITMPLPKIPPLQQLMGGQDSDMSAMQGDAPGHEQFRMPHMNDYDSTPHYGATTKRIFTFAKPTPPELHLEDPTICFFDVQDKTDGYVVSKATLYFYVQPAKLLQTTVHLMSVSRVVMMKGGRGMIKLDTVREEKIVLSSRHGEWQSVELTDVVTEWIDSPGTNNGLKIELYDDGGNSVVVTGLTDDEETKKPFLQLRLHDARRRRSRRAAGLICMENQPAERCCRYPLRVVFADFQWDWILMPKAYEANYCSGLCPRMRLQQYTHTKIMSMVNPPPEGYMGPCCSASDMSPLTVLYFDDNADIKYSLLTNMVVESCSCA
ncbi:growth/differentiation factor 8-like [Patiria miniata]|uniref:TGF-beta family profile domain-containing protein n=1 Tax=Patiria miniata TaxID=46514 RepID=A0A913YY75_PATMI|nr:growth/differentiation factor 8-like [Patiria miniata]